MEKIKQLEEQRRINIKYNLMTIIEEASKIDSQLDNNQITDEVINYGLGNLRNIVNNAYALGLLWSEDKYLNKIVDEGEN